MKIETKEFRQASRLILQAIDTQEVSLFNETLELKASGNKLFLNITNRQYYVTVTFNLQNEENFHASVNASLFLKLIDKITTDTIEILIEGNSVKVVGNGTYKLPIIYNNDSMLELPIITLDNKTAEFEISTDILQSIVSNNSKELLRGIPNREAQKYYYIDEKGCITFVSGACVNYFELPQPIKMQLSSKVVKLFKLFKDTAYVKFSMFQDPISDNMIQTKVKFTNDKVVLIAKLPNSSLINDVPVDSIRNMCMKEFPYSLVLDKNQLSAVIDRLRLFTTEKNYGYFDFSRDSLTISDFSRENKETVSISSDCPTLESYSVILNLDNFKLILDGCTEDYITICFGDGRSVLVKKPNIAVSELLPELKFVNV